MVVIAGDLVKLREEYESADPATKKLMEQRYGKKAIQQIVEESYSLDWISSNSKQCPHCSTPIQVNLSLCVTDISQKNIS